MKINGKVTALYPTYGTKAFLNVTERNEIAIDVWGLSHSTYLFQHGNNAVFGLVVTDSLQEFIELNPDMKFIGVISDIIQGVTK